MLIFALLLQTAAHSPAVTPKSPGEIVAAAPASDWVDIKPDDLLVMQLAPDRDGQPRRVTIQLMAPPFSQPWIANIRTLAKAHWWDGTSVNRVQDNYVVQWGDATEKKPLPAGLLSTSEKGYVSDWRLDRSLRTSVVDLSTMSGLDEGPKQTDPYVAGGHTLHWKGWQLAAGAEQAWPTHCYGMIGVGRNLSPDAGNGAELYTVIGHAPRHLDRNIAVVGRVVEGIENLSSLPRGTGSLGFYEKPEQRVPIVSIRLASELPETERPHLQYLSTESGSFAAYANARANRKDAFFIVPAGGADICNVPVPIRRKP
ncbi:peptidylprolyl isomerase [Sphingomonas tabacisoli]|uniref:Peptidylprolyl isomerase n=1 Tax=Sphingomonas tabacisoli TaxID=2249466 RepID=A0ABW4I147_9SPHN